MSSRQLKCDDSAVQVTLLCWRRASRRGLAYPHVPHAHDSVRPGGTFGHEVRSCLSRLPWSMECEFHPTAKCTEYSFRYIGGFRVAFSGGNLRIQRHARLILQVKQWRWGSL